jgi:hypothetical protein
MPRVSWFFGISIYLYFNDHDPPHFHARYSGHKAKIAMDPLRILEGRLPPRVLGLVLEWASSHRQEL